MFFSCYLCFIFYYIWEFIVYVCVILEYEAITQTAVCYVTQTLEKSMWLDAIGGGEKKKPKKLLFYC